MDAPWLRQPFQRQALPKLELVWGLLVPVPGLSRLAMLVVQVRRAHQAVKGNVVDGDVARRAAAFEREDGHPRHVFVFHVR